MRLVANEMSDVYVGVRVSCASIQCAVVRGESIYCSKNIGRPWWTAKGSGKKKIRGNRWGIGSRKRNWGEGGGI